MSRVGRLLAAATLVGGLFVSASPAMAARPSFAFTACWTGSSVQATITWSGYRVESYDFGAGQSDGTGLGFVDVLDAPTTSGTISHDWGAVVDDTFDLVGADIYGHNTRRALDSGTTLRPAGGWADLDPC